MTQLFSNNAGSEVSGSLPVSGTTVTLSAGTGSRFPAPTAGDFFLGTLYEKDLSGNEINVEIVKVTNRIADTLTIVRDFESMTGNAGGYGYPTGAGTTVFFELRWTAYAAGNVLQRVNDLNDLTSAATARTNLGLGTAATTDATAYEPADPTILKDADIGVSVQAYAAALGLVSGTNTGDNAVNSQYSGLVSNATHTGDATGDTELTVVKINGTQLSSLATGLLKNTTGTGVPSIAVSGTDIKTINGSSILGSGDLTVGGGGVTLSGNLSPYVTQVTTLTITNYDSATTYTLSATGGTASRVGDTITYTAGATAGTFAIIIAGRAVPITVQAASVAAPTITAPTSGQTNVAQAPTITTAAFATIGAADTHLNTDWEIRTAASGGGTLIASSLADASNLLSWSMPGSLLVVATTYYARVRHRGTTLGAGGWSEHAFTTAASFAPTVPGEAYQGGFYAGRVVIGGQTYCIVVAPKSSGHHSSKLWKTANDTTSGTLSLHDGLTNSNAMNNASHPAAQFCRGLSIGGYSDWYLPSRDELEVCYRNLKPTTTSNTVYASRTNYIGAGNGSDAQGNGDNDNSSPAGGAYTTGSPAQTDAAAFLTGAAEAFDSTYYWASTEFSAPNAWEQTFNNGLQTITSKTSYYSVRAVRKVLI